MASAEQAVCDLGQIHGGEDVRYTPLRCYGDDARIPMTFRGHQDFWPSDTSVWKKVDEPDLPPELMS
ncbi:MAG TPA: hypothetical protein VKA46_20755 [Gemmataceae bacterium]|nr:hypothetical protein [Gemmataceae bacterium]